MGIEKIVENGISFVRQNKNFVIAASFMTLANLADTLTTSYAINSGKFSEGAYYMNYYIETYGVDNFSLIKMGVVLGCLAVISRFKSRARTAYLIGASLSGFATYNIHSLLRY